MALSLGSNIFSLRAQRSLLGATSRLSEALTRLSSGTRINRASDDAAGLSIADALRAKRMVAGAAIRNVSDGLSALNIIDGALAEQRSILTRLYELAEQSANGTYSNTQRRALSTEYNELVAEFGRIGDSTTFNNRKLLRSLHSDGAGSMSLQVGTDGSANSQLSLDGIDTGTLSGLFVGGTSNGTSFVDSWSFDQISTKFRDRLIRTTVTDNTGARRDLFLASGSHLAFDGVSFTVNFRVFQRVADTGGAGAQTGAGGQGDVRNANDDLVYSGVYAVTFNAVTGRFMNDETESLALEFEDGAATATLGLDFSGLTFSTSQSNSLNTTLEGSGIETVTFARAALSTVSERLNNLTQQTGAIGAAQSRLESSLAVLKASRENETAAEARIRDADIAQESAILTASQILQQISASVLAQANLAPNLALSLLRTTPARTR